MAIAHQSGADIGIAGVSQHYKDFVALDAVDLDVRAGEFLTLLGASGSGKSTLLSIIAGFNAPSAGTVTVGGRDVTGVPPHKRGLGMVFQNYALFPHLSVFDNIAFPLRRRKVAKAEVRAAVADVLDLVELGSYAGRRPAELSGGQQQRVALARAIVFNPSVLLLDEPLGALDKKLRDQLQFELKRLHRELGMTFVFVTHDQEEALAMSDRIALMREGQVVQVGTPSEIYDAPAERYVAEFLGESNILDGPDGTATMVRPEDLVLLADATGVPAGWTGMPGTVRDVVYLGGSRRIEVLLFDGTRVVARTTAEGAAVVERCAGQVVCAWNPQRATVFGPDGRTLTGPGVTGAVPA